MMIRWFLLACCLVSLHASPAWAQTTSPAAQLEDATREVGPFDIKDQQFTVVLRSKRVEAQGPAPDLSFQETFTRLEIKDAAGRVHYEKSLPIPEVSDGSFVETTDTSALLLQGKQGSGLLVVYNSLPSTPLGGTSYQVFGLFDNKLVPFSKPLYLEGSLVNEESGDQLIQTSEELNFQGDVLLFRLWMGNFFVIFPARLDWLQAKISPAWLCQRMTARGPQPLCRYRVQTERVPPEEDPTFVRLFPEPEEAFTPAHLVVKKDSSVEFLEVECEVVWGEDADGVGLSISDDPWIKVRIDGKEGWIHTQEDFIAIGLPQAG
ncbi:MAG: hypothetical protein HY648_14260 [Acidobacteria bacterium]|nr:hypothetical protein [Acidobacteriota bacterium]